MEELTTTALPSTILSVSGVWPKPAESAVDEGAPPGDRRSSASALVTKTFGKYRFLAVLGHGGMADVYLAVAMGPAGFSKLQVIKKLRPLLADDPDLRTMFLDEARLAARLNHRNIVQTNEVGLAQGHYFISMEYLDGQPYNRILSHARQQHRPVPLEISLRILCDALAGLHYAHELADYDATPLNVVHRDVSPQNVFVTYDGQTKIVDFGIARAARRVVETQAGTIKGKVGYMAPEQAFSHSSELDRRADVFSVGVMLWEAVAGRRLWQGLSDPEIIARMLTRVPRLSEVTPDAPPELLRICARALAPMADDRYATASEMRADLDAYLDRSGPPVSAEDVGAVVVGLFERQRRELGAVIDRQLGALQNEPPSTEIEPALRTTGSLLPEIGQDSLVEDRLTGRISRGGTPHGTLGAVLRPPAEPTRSRVSLIVGGAIVLAVAGGVVVYLRSQDTGGTTQAPPASTAPVAATSPPALPAPPPVAPASSAAAPTAPPVAPESNFIHLKVVVNPIDAKILLDGAEMPSNPFDGKVIKDGAMHRIQVECAGFLPQSRVAVFDKDFLFETTLLPRPKASAVDTAGGALTAKPDPYGPR
jgi:eukaryotic-like serine/threonine-protein kinase